MISTFEVAWSSGNVDGVFLQHRERDYFQGPLMSRGEHDVGSRAVLVGPEPVECSHTPPISGYETRKAKLGHRSSEVVADSPLMREKLGRDNRTDCVASPIFEPGPAAPVPVEAGERVGAAELELAAQHVTIPHPGIISHGTGDHGNAHELIHLPVSGDEGLSREQPGISLSLDLDGHSGCLRWRCPR